MRQVLLHPLAGVLSAYGIGLADEGQLLEQSVALPLTQELLPKLERWTQRLLLESVGEMVSSGLQLQRTLQLRLASCDRG
jgi:5-oxoprolinase (ATP-hydrolysing)